MKKSYLLLLLLLVFPLNFTVLAQNTDALLLFARYDKETQVRSLHVLNATTGEQHQITDSVDDAGWASDGRVWVVDTVDGERRLRFFDVASGAESTFEERLYLDSCFPSLRWSPNGAQLAYFTGNENERVMKMLNLVDGSRYELPSAPGEVPLWSSDGRYFLVNVPYLGAPYRLYAAADGQELLTNMQWTYFSADSRYLLYTDEENTVWWYELATGNTTEVKTAPELIYPISSSSGRYTLFDVYPYTESLYYYDSEKNSVHHIELGYSVYFAAWGAGENSVLLHADYVDYAGDAYPTTLLSYDLVSGESTTLLTDTGWISRTQRMGDWVVVRYDLTPPEYRFAPTAHLLLLHGEQRIEAEFLIPHDANWVLGSSIMDLGSESGFLIAASDGLYHFDNQNEQFEAIYSRSTSYPFVAADGDYVAFLTANADGFFRDLNIWNTASKSISQLSQEADWIGIIGWRGGSSQNSLLYCGEG